MAVLVQTGGKIKITPTDYEQLIHYTMLYDSGNENTPVTGSWTIYRGTVTKNANNIAIGSNGVLHTANAIPFTQYEKMYAVGVASATNHVYLACAKSDHATPLYEWFGVNKGIVGIDLATALDTYVAQIGADNGYTGTVYNVFLVKADDINTLCSKAGLSAPTSLDTLLSDTTSLTTIFNSEDAVKFMVKQCTGDFMVGVLNSADAVALLKASPYLNTVVGNPHWAKFMMIIPVAQELLGYAMTYDSGDECTDRTGGWDKWWIYGTGAYTKNADNIYMYGYTTSTLDSNGTGAGTLSKVDMSAYSQIHFVGDSIASLPNTNSEATIIMRLKSAKDNSTGSDDSQNIISQQVFSPGTGRTLCSMETVDSAYICFVVYGSRSGSLKYYLTDVFLTKTDNWQTWASLAGITATSLDTLLSDSTKMATLMANEESCKYLMGCTGDLMISICNSETAMSALVNNIAYDYAFNHPVWYKFMTMIPTSLSAMDSVAVTVPTMTSNTAPSGIASASAIASSDYDAYKAFDKKTTLAVGNVWGSPNSSTTDQWVQYEFVEPISLYKFVYHSYNPSATSNSNIQNYKLQYSDDGVTFNDAIIGVFANPCNAVEIILEKPVTAKIWRLYVVDSYGTGSGTGLAELQFYGKAVTE